MHNIASFHGNQHNSIQQRRRQKKITSTFVFELKKYIILNFWKHLSFFKTTLKFAEVAIVSEFT
jgi:hypothetical protein